MEPDTPSQLLLLKPIWKRLCLPSKTPLSHSTFASEPLDQPSRPSGPAEPPRTEPPSALMHGAQRLPPAHGQGLLCPRASSPRCHPGVIPPVSCGVAKAFRSHFSFEALVRALQRLRSPRCVQCIAPPPLHLQQKNEPHRRESHSGS